MSTRERSWPVPAARVTYALAGIPQFIPRFRRSHRAWHRRAGRVLGVAGLLLRAEAIGLAAGTQVFTEGVGGAIFGTGVVPQPAGALS
jgi:hypothetical protein